MPLKCLDEETTMRPQSNEVVAIETFGMEQSFRPSWKCKALCETEKQCSATLLICLPRAVLTVLTRIHPG